jgi:hypothetical protein
MPKPLTKRGAAFEGNVIAKVSFHIKRRMSCALNIMLKTALITPRLCSEQISIILCYCFFSRLYNTVKCQVNNIELRSEQNICYVYNSSGGDECACK